MQCLFFKASTIKATSPQVPKWQQPWWTKPWYSTWERPPKITFAITLATPLTGDKLVERSGGSRPRSPRRPNGSSRNQQSRHSQRENDRPRSPSRSPLPSPSRSTEGVRRRGGSRSRPPIRRNGSSRGEQSRHSQRESDRPRSSSRSPLPPPSRSTEGTRGGSRSSSSFLHGYHLPLSHVLHRLPSLLLSRVIKEKSWQYRAAQEARI